MRVGAADLEAALKIITGPDVAPGDMTGESRAAEAPGEEAGEPGEQASLGPGEGVSRERCQPGPSATPSVFPRS